jgi:serine/threonine protein kinase
MARNLQRVIRDRTATTSFPKRYVHLFLLPEVHRKIEVINEAITQQTSFSEDPSSALYLAPFLRLDAPSVTPLNIVFYVAPSDVRRYQSWAPISERLPLGSPSALPLAKRVLRSVLQALLLMHRHHVVHSAITLASVMMDGGGHVKLSNHFLVPGFFAKGSPLYEKFYRAAAPEVSRNDVFGAEVDVWSVGVLLLQMLLPSVDHHRLTTDALSDAHAQNEFLSLIGGDGEAMDFILRCLCVDASRRPTLVELMNHSLLKMSPRTRLSKAEIAAAVGNSRNESASDDDDGNQSHGDEPEDERSSETVDEDSDDDDPDSDDPDDEPSKVGAS